MNSNNKSASNIIKGMAMGIALGSAVTMMIAGKKDIVKKVSESANDGVSSMFKFH